MIRIKKGREPGKLLWYRQQDGASYEQMDKEVREELIDQLLRDRGIFVHIVCPKFRKAEISQAVYLRLR